MKVILQMLSCPSGTGCQTPKCRRHFMNSSFWWQLKPFSTFLSNTSLLILITKSSFPTIPPYPSPHSFLSSQSLLPSSLSSQSLPHPSTHSPYLIPLLTVTQSLPHLSPHSLTAPPSSLSSPSLPHPSPHSPFLTLLLTVPPSSLSSVSQSLPHPCPHSPSLIPLLTVPPSSLSSQSLPHLSPQSHSPSLIPVLTVPPSSLSSQSLPPSSLSSQSLPHPSTHSPSLSLSSQSQSPSLISLLTVPPSSLFSQSLIHPSPHSPSLIPLLTVPPSSLSSQFLPHSLLSQFPFSIIFCKCNEYVAVSCTVQVAIGTDTFLSSEEKRALRYRQIITYILTALTYIMCICLGQSRIIIKQMHPSKQVRCLKQTLRGE